MKNAWRRLFLTTAALAPLLAPAPSRAAVYELASEWQPVSFKDGDKDRVLFTHLQDADMFAHMKEFETSVSSGGSALNFYVPLYELVQRKSGEVPPAKGSSLALARRPTPYKMLIRFDRVHTHHVIERPPDFSTRDSTTSATLPSIFGVAIEHPDNLLVMVQPEQTQDAGNGLSDIELAAIKSLDASQRTALVGQCGGEPGTAVALTCWHQQVAIILAACNRLPEERFASSDSAKENQNEDVASDGCVLVSAACCRVQHELSAVAAGRGTRWAARSSRTNRPDWPAGRYRAVGTTRHDRPDWGHRPDR